MSATIAPSSSRPPIDPPTAPAITPTLAPGESEAASVSTPDEDGGDRVGLDVLIINVDNDAVETVLAEGDRVGLVVAEDMLVTVVVSGIGGDTVGLVVAEEIVFVDTGTVLVDRGVVVVAGQCIVLLNPAVLRANRSSALRRKSSSSPPMFLQIETRSGDCLSVSTFWKERISFPRGLQTLAPFA